MTPIARPSVPPTYAKPTIQKAKARVETKARKMDFGKTLLDSTWYHFHRLPSCEQQFDCFETTMKQLVDEHCPVREETKGSSSNSAWVTDSSGPWCINA